MTREIWHWRLERAGGDTMTFVLADPAFLPAREWRTMLVRID
jgi:hypothetical protein